MLTNKKIVVTGGTGSLGKVLVRRLLSGVCGRPKQVTIFSRDEAKQHEGESHHRDRHPAPGSELDETHLPEASAVAVLPAVAPAASMTWISVPSRIATLPAVTTMSPSFTPERISASSPLL